MATTIVTKYGGDAPAASDIVRGELAVDTENGRLYTENSSGAVVEIGLKPEGNVDVTGTVTADGVTSTTSSSMTQLTVNGTGAIESGINFANGGTTYGQIYFNNVSPYDMSVLQQYSTGSLIFGTNDTERMRLDSSGNFGIGATPIAPLHVKGTTNGNLLVRAGSLAVNTLTGTALSSINDAASATVPLTFEGSEFNFVQSNAVKVKVDSSGNVGIGTSSPSNLLSLKSGTNTDIEFGSESGGGFIQTYNRTSSAYGYLRFITSGSETMRLDTSGNVGIGTTSPVSELDVAGTTPTLTIKDTQNKSWTSSDTTLGELAFRTSDASGIGAHNVAFVRAVNDISSSTTPSGALSFGVSASNTNASEAIRIDSSGNVGIGNSGPASYGKFVVQGTGNLLPLFQPHQGLGLE